MNILKFFIYTISVTTVFVACNKKQEIEEQPSGLIEITHQQFNTDKMQTGKLSEMVFEKSVKCNGYIVPFPNGLVKVFAPLSGVIKSINTVNGQLVEKHQALLEITGNELIDLQKEFAEAAALFKRLKNDYDRVKLLYQEKVTSDKDYISVESEFNIASAKYSGLKMKLEAIGLSPSKIEKGQFSQSYFIISPVKGYVSSLNAHPGNFITSQTELMDIINPDMLQIKLSVFSSDISEIKKGQRVNINSVSTNTSYTAEISATAKAYNTESNAIDCYAVFTGSNESDAIVNDYIEAEIITNKDTVLALPEEAVIKTDHGNFILVLKNKDKTKFFFNQVKVKTGRNFNGFTEIIDANISGEILISGLYNISL